MDLDSFSTLSLGSTLGFILIVLTYIELSSSGDAKQILPVHFGLAEAWRLSYAAIRYLFYGFISYARNPRSIGNGTEQNIPLSREQILLGPTVSLGRLRIELEEAWSLFYDIAKFFLLGCCWILYAVLHAQRTYRLVRKEFEAHYGECSKKTLKKLFRVVKIWEPLPYDLMRDMSKEERERPMENKTGLIGVCLRFREGTLEHRLRQNGSWQLHSRVVSFPAYFPLEKDGSLSVDLLRERFSIEEIELLIPGRYNVLRVSAGDLISPISLHVLTQIHGYVNIVEHEDAICQTRRRFRQWLRVSLIFYLGRIAGYVSAIISCVAIGAALSGILSGRIGWYFNHSLGFTVAACLLHQYFNYRRINSGTGTLWYAFPERHSRYCLHDKMDAFKSAIFL